MRSRSSRIERMILDPELPLTSNHPSQNKPSNSSRNSKFYFQDQAKTKVLSAVQLFAGLYYMGDTNLPELPYMARRSSWSHSEQLLRRCATCAPPKPPNNTTCGLHVRGPLRQASPFNDIPLLGSRSPKHQSLESCTFENLTP